MITRLSFVVECRYLEKQEQENSMAPMPPEMGFFCFYIMKDTRQLQKIAGIYAIKLQRKHTIFQRLIYSMS